MRRVRVQISLGAAGAIVALVLAGCGAAGHAPSRRAVALVTRPTATPVAATLRSVTTAVADPNALTAEQLRLVAQARRAAPSVERLLRGIPESGDVLGSPTAPVTLTYYGDLECPICKDFALGSLVTLIGRDVRAGRVKIRYVAQCTSTCNTRRVAVFIAQQAAALAAGRQHLFWDYAQLFEHAQGAETTPYVNDLFLEALARATPGLDYAAWLAAFNAPAVRSEVGAQLQSATAHGINATPTLVFTGPGRTTQQSESIPTYAELEAAVRRAS